jgi:hypothetical protein
MDQLKALPETTALEVTKCRETHLASINRSTSYNIHIYSMYKYIYYIYIHTCSIPHIMYIYTYDMYIHINI